MRYGAMTCSPPSTGSEAVELGHRLRAALRSVCCKVASARLVVALAGEAVDLLERAGGRARELAAQRGDVPIDLGLIAAVLGELEAREQPRVAALRRLERSEAVELDLRPRPSAAGAASDA